MNFSLLIPWLLLTSVPGILLLHFLLPTSVKGRSTLVLGYGLLLNLIGVTLIMRFLDLIGVAFTFVSVATAVVVIFSAAIILLRQWGSRDSGPVHLEDNRIGAAGKLLLLLCLALISLRFISLGVELTQRPVFAWDSKQHWGKQAKVFLEAGRIVSYVPLEDWLRLADPRFFTNMHTDYPVTIPLLQVWANLPGGTWDDTLMNLPWMLLYLAMGLIFYGQLRCSSVDVVTAVACTYMLLSMPYMNTQIALAGYADVVMGAIYLAAVAAFYQWSVTRHLWQGSLALVLGLACLMIKNEGLFWMLSMLPGMLLVYLGVKKGLCVTSALLLIALALVCVLPLDLVVAGHSLDDMQLAYRPSSWQSIRWSFFTHDNWHLLGYLALAVTFLTVVFARQSLYRFAPVLIICGCAIALYLGLYLLTRHAHGAIYFTSLNRVALQIMPALAFTTSLLFASFCSKYFDGEVIEEITALRTRKRPERS